MSAEDMKPEAAAETSAPAPAAPRKSFLKSTLGKTVLVGGALLAIGAGVATAQGWRGHGHGFGPMGGGMMGRGGIERFCAADVGYVTQKMADGLSARLNLTDAQKPALNDLRATAVQVAGEAKKLCATTPDMSTVPGRLAVAQQRLSMANAAMTTLKPKIEAFYATLDEAQKKTVDQMGPMGRGKGGMGGHGWRHGQGGPGGMGPGMGPGMMGPGMGPGWRQGQLEGRGARSSDWQ